MRFILIILTSITTLMTGCVLRKDPIEEGKIISLGMSNVAQKTCGFSPVSETWKDLCSLSSRAAVSPAISTKSGLAPVNGKEMLVKAFTPTDFSSNDLGHVLVSISPEYLPAAIAGHIKSLPPDRQSILGSLKREGDDEPTKHWLLVMDGNGHTLFVWEFSILGLSVKWEHNPKQPSVLSQMLRQKMSQLPQTGAPIRCLINDVGVEPQENALLLSWLQEKDASDPVQITWTQGRSQHTVSIRDTKLLERLEVYRAKSKASANRTQDLVNPLTPQLQQTTQPSETPQDQVPSLISKVPLASQEFHILQAENKELTEKFALQSEQATKETEALQAENKALAESLALQSQQATQRAVALQAANAGLARRLSLSHHNQHMQQKPQNDLMRESEHCITYVNTYGKNEDNGDNEDIDYSESNMDKEYANPGFEQSGDIDESWSKKLIEENKEKTDSNMKEIGDLSSRNEQLESELTVMRENDFELRKKMTSMIAELKSLNYSREKGLAPISLSSDISVHNGYEEHKTVHLDEESTEAKEPKGTVEQEKMLHSDAVNYVNSVKTEFVKIMNELLEKITAKLEGNKWSDNEYKEEKTSLWESIVAEQEEVLRGKNEKTEEQSSSSDDNLYSWQDSSHFEEESHFCSKNEGCDGNKSGYYIEREAGEKFAQWEFGQSGGINLLSWKNEELKKENEKLISENDKILKNKAEEIENLAAEKNLLALKKGELESELMRIDKDNLNLSKKMTLMSAELKRLNGLREKDRAPIPFPPGISPYSGSEQLKILSEDEKPAETKESLDDAFHNGQKAAAIYIEKLLIDAFYSGGKKEPDNSGKQENVIHSDVVDYANSFAEIIIEIAADFLKKKMAAKPEGIEENVDDYSDRLFVLNKLGRIRAKLHEITNQKEELQAANAVLTEKLTFQSEKADQDFKPLLTEINQLTVQSQKATEEVETLKAKNEKLARQLKLSSDNQNLQQELAV